MENNKIKKVLIPILTCILISLVAEMFVFNYEYFTSSGSNPEAIDFEAVETYDEEDGSYIHEQGSDNPTFLAENINKDVKYLYLDFLVESTDPRLDWDKVRDANITIYAKDEGRSSFYEMGHFDSYPTIENSKYVKLNPYGKISELKIELTNDTWSYNSFQLKNAVINAHVPLNFMPLRVLFLTLILLLLYSFRPTSKLYKFTARDNKKYAGILLFLFAFVNIMLMIPLALENIHYIFEDNPGVKQYELLAEAISQGRVNINVDHLELLKGLNNPYDTTERTNCLVEHGLSLIDLWDIAYFDGNAYVYFGIVPVLLYYLPFLLLTGHQMNAGVAVLITSILIIIEGYRLINALVKTYFKDTSLGVQLLMTFVYVNACGTVIATQTPSLYYLPIVVAVLFVTAGLRMYLTAKCLINENKSKGLTLFYIFFGALFMALSVGCRPQFALASFLLIPIFWDVLFKDRKIVLKNNVSRLLCVAVPYVIVAAGLMYYNYIRFGSPLDFGANYNLTTNDMRLRSFNLFRLLPAMSAYFVQPPNLAPYFPFILSTPENYASYVGMTIYEPMFGGVLFSQCFILMSFGAGRVKEMLKTKKAFALWIVLLIIPVVVAIMDSEMSGILSRYYIDFVWLLILAGIIVTLALFEKYGAEKKLVILVITLMVVTIIFNYFIGFGSSTFYYCPSGYHWIRNLFY
ncbi:MAG: hypothetical protein IKF64_07585 [Eubacterium sp.]|nr:hypothetical protein [Eubacterium sp.]